MIFILHIFLLKNYSLDNSSNHNSEFCTFNVILLIRTIGKGNFWGPLHYAICLGWVFIIEAMSWFLFYVFSYLKAILKIILATTFLKLACVIRYFWLGCGSIVIGNPDNQG